MANIPAISEKDLKGWPLAFSRIVGFVGTIFIGYMVTDSNKRVESLQSSVDSLGMEFHYKNNEISSKLKSHEDIEDMKWANNSSDHAFFKQGIDQINKRLVSNQ